MKKLLATFLCIVTVLSLAGCVNKAAAEASNVIDLGGGIGKITLEGVAYGKYKKIDTPEEFDFEGTQTSVYEDQSSDTPYVVVCRFAKDDYTLEMIAQEEADNYSQGYYEMFDKGEMVGQRGAFICCSYKTDTAFYYVDVEIYEDGDDFVEIGFYGKSEELKIGDSDVYAWIPVGYTNALTQDGIDHGAIIWSEYSDDYYFPSMWIGKWDSSYEYLCWLWEYQYPDVLPISEEEYTDMLANWNEESIFDYYKTLGAEVVFSSTKENESYPYEGEYTVLTGIADATDLWFQIGEDWYSAWFTSELDTKPAYAGVFLNSLHTK